MSVAIFVNILEGLLHNNVSHVLRILRVKEGSELLKGHFRQQYWQEVFQACVMYLNVELSTVVKIGHRPAPLVTCFHLLIRESMFFLLSIFFIKEPIDILPEKRTDELQRDLTLQDLYSSQLIVSFPSGL